MTYHNVVALIKGLEQRISRPTRHPLAWINTTLLQPGSPAEGHDF